MNKAIFVQRLDDFLKPPAWMKFCYRDYERREVVWAVWPLNYAIQLAWMLNLGWSKYRHRPSWIEMEIQRRKENL